MVPGVGVLCVQATALFVVHQWPHPHPLPLPSQITPGLPKTRSGKIMRRMLRKVAAGDVEDLGDTSTLADPSVVQHICAKAKQSRKESANNLY